MTKSTSFPLQAKMTRLEEIEKYFQRADVDLEEAIKLHDEALKVALEIQAYLKTAEQSLEKVDIAALRRDA